MNEFWLQMIATIKSMRSPMRPEAAEITFIERSIAAHQVNLDQKAGQALLLGVTEEIVTMDWPEEVFLESVDRSEAMIGAFWKGDLAGRRRLRLANWWEMDQEFGPYRYAIGDGVFNIQPFPDGYRAFAEKLHALMEPGGLGYFRVFCRPPGGYSPADVLKQYVAGKFNSFQELRFCHAIAMQASVTEGSALNIPDAVRSLSEHGIPRGELQQLPDFEAVARPMLDIESPHTLRLYYPTPAEFENAVSPWFTVKEIGFGDHPLARLCPTFCLLRQ